MERDGSTGEFDAVFADAFGAESLRRIFDRKRLRVVDHRVYTQRRNLERELI